MTYCIFIKFKIKYISSLKLIDIIDGIWISDSKLQNISLNVNEFNFIWTGIDILKEFMIEVSFSIISEIFIFFLYIVI